MAFFFISHSRLDIKTQSVKRFAGCVMSLVYDLDSPKERKLIRNLSREYLREYLQHIAQHDTTNDPPQVSFKFAMFT